MKRYFFSLAIVLFSLPALAFEVGSPIACQIGKDCFIQNYVDQDPSPGWKDYHCGSASYNGHKGTDIRLKTLQDLSSHVAVIAAASGKVRGVRDGMEDISIRKIARESIKDKECGNGVVIMHEGGWETQYCHMKKGSVAVKPGQEVKIGDKLGEVGLSGDTEFPHLHFEIRKAGQVIDPFSGFPKEHGCNSAETLDNSLWAQAARPSLQYQPTHLLAAGFLNSEPTVEGVNEGQYENAPFPSNSQKMIFWAEIMGFQAGDKFLMQIIDPAGAVIVTKEITAPQSRAVQFNYIGKILKEPSWKSGTYKGKVAVSHSGKVIFEETRDLKI